MILEKPADFSSSPVTPKSLLSDSLWFIFLGDRILVNNFDEDVSDIPTLKKISSTGTKIENEHYLGKLNNQQCYVAEAVGPTINDENLVWIGLRSAFNILSEKKFSIAGRAYQIINWSRTNMYCGKCGNKTHQDQREFVKICSVCEFKMYPRISPAVMALICRGKEFLLARSPHFPEGMFSAIAGFSEPGETLEQTIHREVFEEVGLTVSNIRYFASQPWPFPHSMMIAFHCDYLRGEIKCDPEEIEDAKWFSPTNLPPKLPGEISIARELLNSKIYSAKGTL